MRMAVISQVVMALLLAKMIRRRTAAIPRETALRLR
jgi:hypothetical protein